MPEPRKLKDFFEAGLAHIKRSGGAAVIEPYSPEWDAWAQYFGLTYGAVPVVFDMAERRQIESITMPEQWPELFDIRYVRPVSTPSYRKQRRPHEIHEAERERTERAMDRLQQELAGNLSMRKVDAKARQQEAAERQRQREEERRVRECEAAGIDPSLGISPSLAAKLDEWARE